MSNKVITRILKENVALKELHGANSFSVKAYQSAIFGIEKSSKSIENWEDSDWKEARISAKIRGKIEETLDKGTFEELEELREKTPIGVQNILQIKGLGAKKVAVLWKEHQVEEVAQLKQMCIDGKLADIKGFGAKTQEKILSNIVFVEQNASKLLLSEAIEARELLLNFLSQLEHIEEVAATGQCRRLDSFVDQIDVCVSTNNKHQLQGLLGTIEDFKWSKINSSPYQWNGTWANVPVCIHFCSSENFKATVYILSASEQHLNTKSVTGETLKQWAKKIKFEKEEELYEAAGIPFIPVEAREGLVETDCIENGKTPSLVQDEDLKGVLHNHSTYSDGKHTLEEMAVGCKELGYDYLGISDHSKTAFYANGLDENRIKEQHKEIDELNKKLAPFKIFKGIESDILSDGSLDYEDEVLASFDFIVASIHANLSMDVNKATQRLINAIKNPYTSILGHPTGRLLLRREAYPIDHKAIIDACAAHHVAIEINANPWRLDLDWKWVNYALSQGVKIAINPDAHEIDGYDDMKYGVMMGRKAGLSPEMTLNAMSIEELDEFFKKQKELKKV